MGLADRDYMRERHQSRPKRGGGAVREGLGTIPWKHALVTVGLLTLLALWLFRYFDGRADQAFPQTGEVNWYIPTTQGETAPLTIVAPVGSKHHFALKLADWHSGRPVALIPVRSGETAKIEMPLGEYQVTIASGRSWRGVDKLFGRTGEVRRAVAPLHFYRTQNGTTGIRIDLAQRINGNLETRPVGIFEK